MGKTGSCQASIFGEPMFRPTNSHGVHRVFIYPFAKVSTCRAAQRDKSSLVSWSSVINWTHSSGCSFCERNSSLLGTAAEQTHCLKKMLKYPSHPESSSLRNQGQATSNDSRITDSASEKELIDEPRHVVENQPTKGAMPLVGFTHPSSSHVTNGQPWATSNS